jgi:hypothetical protein
MTKEADRLAEIFDDKEMAEIGFSKWRRKNG